MPLAELPPSSPVQLVLSSVEASLTCAPGNSDKHHSNIISFSAKRLIGQVTVFFENKDIFNLSFSFREHRAPAYA